MRSGGLLSETRFTPRCKAGALLNEVWALLLAVVFLLSIAGDARAEYVTEGYGGPSFAAAGVIAPTGDKPQSKLWYAQDSWWGSLFVPGSLAANGQAGFKIHRLEWSTQEWTDTQVLIDARPDGRMDVLWDGTSLYVASAGANPADTGDSVQISKFTWDAAAGEYVLAPGFPVTIVDGGVEAVVLDKDTTGTLWITYTRDLKVYVARTTTDDASWGTPYVIPVPEAVSLSADDISAIVAFRGKIGVMWSSTADWNAHSMFFATHADGAADGAWTVEPALQLPGYVDDHINLKSLQTNNRGQVYAATKTSLTGAADDLILLLVLSKQGAWQRYTFSVAADEQTRPLVLLDPTSDRIHMFASAPGGPGGVVYYKSSPMNRISFGPGPGTPFLLSETDVNINNAAGTKQTVSPTTGLVVIASDDHTKRYLHNSIDLGIIDTIPPDTKILSAPLDREPVFSPTFEFESNEDGVTFEVSVDGGEYVVSGATHTASRLSAGAHTLSVRAVDATGNIDPVPAQWSWEVDPFVVNFDTVADAYFDQATPSINYGSDRNLIVDGVTTGTNESRAVLRFDVPPGAETPVSVAVHLYAHNGVSVNGPFIYLTSDPWDETTVNWVNQPGTPDPPLSQDASIPVNTWGSFDVTAAVGAGGTYDFLLDQSSSDGVFFYAREVPLHRPHIALTYATAPNFAPEIDPVVDVQGYQGAEITFQAVGWDPMGDELTFSLTDAPAAAVIDPATGVFSWTSGIGDVPGVYPVTVRVTDPGGLYAETSLAVTVLQSIPVSGAVRDGSGAAIVGATVQALSDAGAVMDWTTTDSDGAYALVGLPPGRYRFQAFMDGYYGEWYDDVRVVDDPDGAAATPIVLTAEITGLDFVLAEVPTTISRPVVAGWNLLAGAPGSDILGETAFAYVGGVYQSTSGASFVAGLGYWVGFSEAGTATLQAVAAPVGVHLSAGWNLIGNPTQDTLALPVGLTAFTFVDGVYITSDTLEPGQGAWVRSAAEQDIVLEGVG